MRALTLTSFDGLDGVVLADVPEPQVGEDTVTVRVHAAALGPWDVATTEGMFASAGGLTTFPQTIGWDFAGTIAAAGTAVTQWKPGDRVLGFSPQPWTGIGAIAELIAVPPDLIAALPAELDFVTGATLPVTALTAHLAIENGQVQPGASLLVIGAAGAVGGVIVQLGAKLGAQIIASVAADDFQAVRELGATETVDRTADLAAQVKKRIADGVDVTIDLAGPVVWGAAIDATRDGGRFVTTSPAGLPDAVRGISTCAIAVQPDAPALTALARRFADGSLRTRIAAVMPMTQARDVLEAMRRGSSHGKYVLDLQQRYEQS
jgi:NADPH2:quinone reductase